MSHQERIAWINLSILGPVVLLSVILFVTSVISGSFGTTLPLEQPVEMSWKQQAPMFGILFGIFGIFGILFVFFRRKGKTIIEDERDQAIARQSLSVAFFVFWLFFILGTMGIWAWGQYSGEFTTMPVSYLPRIALNGFFVVKLIESITVIVLYRKGLVDASF